MLMFSRHYAASNYGFLSRHYATWTSRLTSDSRLEMKKLKSEKGDNPVIRFASASNWARYSLTEPFWVSLKRSPIGSSYGDCAKRASIACRKPNHVGNWWLQAIHWNQARAGSSMWKDTMVSHFDSGIECYSKNWVILNTQPEGSEPSNLGTSSF